MSSKINYLNMLIVLIPLLIGYLFGFFFIRTRIPGFFGFILSGLTALIGAIIGALILKFILKRKI